jgi:glycine cleavage system H protein
MENPKELYYTKEHEWIKVENEIGTVGITDFAQNSLTDIVFVELPEKGKEVKQFKPLAVLESVKSVSDVYSPVSGEVIEVNEKLNENPEKINESPFQEGWIAKIKIKNKDELKNLMSAEQYDEYLKSKK